MARKRTGKKPIPKHLKRIIGIACALLVLLGALLGSSGGALFTLDAGAEAQPSLEQYVNYKDEVRDGNVHLDLETGEETFSLDLQAFIPPDADAIVITEGLNPVFRYVGAENNYHAQIKEGDELGLAPALSEGGYPVPEGSLTVSVEKQSDNKEVLTAKLDLTNLAEDASNTLRGGWLQLGFEARIREEYTINETVLDAVCDSYRASSPVVGNGVVEDALQETHQGFKAQAEYSVIKGTETGETESTPAVYSNIVTIAMLEPEPEPEIVMTEGTDAVSEQESSEEQEAAVAGEVRRSVTKMAAVAPTENDTTESETSEGEQKTEDTQTLINTLARGSDPDQTTKTQEAGTGNGESAGDAKEDAQEEAKEDEDTDDAAGDAAQVRSMIEATQTQGTVSVEGIVVFNNVPESGLPEGVTLTLYADGETKALLELTGEKVATVTSKQIGIGCTVDPASIGHAWGFTITGLDEYAQDGTTKVNYILKESVIPKGYIVTYADNEVAATADNKYQIINTYSAAKAREEQEEEDTEEEDEKEEEEDKVPLGTGTITLLVNGEKKDLGLDRRDDKFYYTIEVTVPEGAKTLTITDTLDPVLKMYSETDEVTVSANGSAVPSEGIIDGVLQKTVTLDGQVLTVRIPDADLYEGKTVTVRFDAIVRSDMDVSAYASNDGEIPNVAKMEVTDGASQTFKKSSATRYVKLPDEPGVKKIVNDTENYVLENRNDPLSYTITARIPLDAVTYTLVDNVSQVIEIKNASAEIDGKSVYTSNLSAKGQEVTLKLDDAYNYAGGMVTMTVNAKIVDGADLSLFNNYKVPNTVTIFVNGRLYETSEPATVDGQVLGVRKGRVRGGQTGDKKLVVDIVIGVAALVALILLLRKRVDF